MTNFSRDEAGFPILLAEPEKKNPFVERAKRGELPEIVTPDATSGPAEWGRYHDAVREAARSFDAPEEGDIHLFLKARARNPDRVNVPAFHEAVQRQRMADLVDIVDHHLRKDGSLPRGSRHIRTQAPKGYLRRALRNSSPEDIAHLRHRLNAIGHDDGKVSDFLSRSVSGDLWDQATNYEITATDAEFDGLVFDAGNFEAEWMDPLGDILEAIANMKPEIHIHIDKKDLE